MHRRTLPSSYNNRTTRAVHGVPCHGRRPGDVGVIVAAKAWPAAKPERRSWEVNRGWQTHRQSRCSCPTRRPSRRHTKRCCVRCSRTTHSRHAGQSTPPWGGGRARRFQRADVPVPPMDGWRRRASRRLSQTSCLLRPWRTRAARGAVRARFASRSFDGVLVERLSNKKKKPAPPRGVRVLRLSSCRHDFGRTIDLRRIRTHGIDSDNAEGRRRGYYHTRQGDARSAGLCGSRA